MTCTFPPSLYRDAIVEVAAAVFETMAAVRVEASARAGEHQDYAYTAAVYYAGAWKGALLLECSAEQAARWTSLFLSLPYPPEEEYIRDGLGEIANVLAGNLKPLLPPGVGLSIPSVVEGSSGSLRLCGVNRVEHVHVADSIGSFRITLVEMVE